MEVSQEEAHKLKQMYILQEEKIALLEQIIKEQGKTIRFLKDKLNIHKNCTEKNTESFKVFQSLANTK